VSFSRIDGRYCTQEDAERLNGQPTEVKEDIDAQTRPREGRMKLYVICHMNTSVTHLVSSLWSCSEKALA